LKGTAPARDLTIGEWTLQPDTNRLVRGDESVAIQPLSMDILAYLVQRPGVVVTPQELLDAFWEKRVVGDDAVHRRIADLRRHLGDDARKPRYIQTIPKRGYRLVANVSNGAVPAAASPVSLPGRRRRRWLAAGAMLALATAAAAILVLRHDGQEGLDESLLAANALLQEDRHQDAYEALRPYLGAADDRVEALLGNIALPIRIVTDPPGVEVAYRYVGKEQDAWIELGRTPVDGARLPRGGYRLRFGTDVLMNATNPGPTLNSAGAPVRVIRMPADPVPEGMVFVPGGKYRLGAWGFENATDLGEFLLDRTEVTNGAFFEFVEAGGYSDEALWQPLIDASAGRLTREDITTRFTDMTGQPGPAGWSLSSYAAGERDMPVTGVSWYEAAAYLHYRGKELPSVPHWLRAALGPMEWKYPFARFLVPASNIGRSAPVPVGQMAQSESHGAVDLIGNVSEWTASGGLQVRAVIGSSFEDPPWSYNFPRDVDPLYRGADVGFRGMRYTARSSPEPLPAYETFEDFTSSVRRISDEMFEGIRLNFAYPVGTVSADQVQLAESVEFDHWTRQRVLIPSGHEGDPLPVYLYLPKRGEPPYQSVLYLPPADSWSPGFRSESVALENYQIDFVPRSGRALVWPVYFGSHERYDDYHAAAPSERSALATERNQRIRNEIGRVMDYLDDSPEFDGGRTALMALSHGAIIASYNLAAEERIRAAILISIGIAPPNPVFANPQNDPNVFWARVRQPVLVINGRYDPIRPYHFVLEPLVDLLATPVEDKRSILYDSAHWPLPRYPMMRDSLDWLDRYLGPVQSSQ